VTDSNRRHPACKAGALPTELTARSPLNIVGLQGDARVRAPKRKAAGRELSQLPACRYFPGGSGLGQTDSFNSLEARKATFLLALIWIASPVAGLRPMRAARLRT
jgi:hypothetical protein